MTGDAVPLRATLGLLDTPACGPPLPMERHRSWRITRRADCLQALRHPAVQTIDIAEELRSLERHRSLSLPGLSTLLGGILFARHAPFHRDGRAYLGQVLAAATAGMPPERIGDRARTLLHGIAPGQLCDMVPICNALPLHVTGLALGLDETTLDALDHTIRRIMTAWALAPDKASLAVLDTEAGNCVAHLHPAFAQARRAGSGALHDALHSAAQYGFDDDQIAGLLLFFVLAALETTSGFLANVVLLLQRCPGLAAATRDDPRLRPKLIGEALRYLGPVRRAGRRRTAADIEIGGRRIPAGVALVIEVEAGNHDGDAYPDPWRFDLHRESPPSLAFGAGAHACLGAASARSLAMHFLDALADYRITAAQDAAPEWSAHPAFRIPRALPSHITFLRSPH